LARFVGAPDGIGVEEACARAAGNVEALSGRALEQIHDSLARIAATTIETATAPNAKQRRDLHQLSCTIAGLGGMFGRDALSKVAYSFCRLIDETEPGWDAPSAAVHVRAMQLLSMPDRTTPEAQARIVEGLKSVRKHLSVHR
jgi:hypothetical protein